MLNQTQFETWFIAQARKTNTEIADWSDADVRLAFMDPRPLEQQKFGTYGAGAAQAAWEAWQAGQQALTTAPVAWIQTDTLKALQDAGKTGQNRWPVYTLSEWADKSNFTPLTIPTTT